MSVFKSHFVSLGSQSTYIYLSLFVYRTLFQFILFVFLRNSNKFSSCLNHTSTTILQMNLTQSSNFTASIRRTLYYLYHTRSALKHQFSAFDLYAIHIQCAEILFTTQIFQCLCYFDWKTISNIDQFVKTTQSELNSSA